MSTTPVSSLSERRARRVRAGGPPPPSSERAELRAAMKHGSYSYGAPPMSLPHTADEVDEALQAHLKATEAKASRQERRWRAVAIVGCALMVFGTYGYFVFQG